MSLPKPFPLHPITQQPGQPHLLPPTSQDAAQLRGLYRADLEHDACGVGFVAHIKGQKSHGIVEQGLL
ncbi:MAG: hypothetical protein ACO3DD_10880, partial [Burkholderiaceae bacterium]